MENTQELLYQFRYLKENRDMIENQLEIVDASLKNLLVTKTTLENLKSLKEGDEVLIPIGGLANVKANIKEPEKILLFVSQDVVVEKNIDNSMEYVEKLISQHNDQIKNLRTQMQNIEANLREMSQQIQQSQASQS